MPDLSTNEHSKLQLVFTFLFRVGFSESGKCNEKDQARIDDGHDMKQRSAASQLPFDLANQLRRCNINYAKENI